MAIALGGVDIQRLVNRTVSGRSAKDQGAPEGSEREPKGIAFPQPAPNEEAAGQCGREAFEWTDVNCRIMLPGLERSLIGGYHRYFSSSDFTVALKMPPGRPFPLSAIAVPK